ncbi:MAG: hypothetical protein ICV72_15220 [Aldersonia sp.]|nr:hypothetical protein [Aldersonia sp.]
MTASRRYPADADALRFWQANAALALVPWAVSLGISIYAFGSEQRAVHLLRLLPLGPRRLFLAKVIAALAPVVILSELIALVVAVATGGGWREVAGMALLVAWGSCGFVTIDTAAAAFAPNFEADHIQRSTDLVGRAFGMIAGAAFGLVSAVAVARVIFFAGGVPTSLQSTFAWEIAGLHPLGWPLAVGAALTALAILALVVTIAVDRLRDLILNGP